MAATAAKPLDGLVSPPVCTNTPPHKVNSHSSRSFAELVKGQKKQYQRMELRFIEPTKVTGTPTVEVPTVVLDAGKEKWKFAVIGHVLGLDPAFRDMARFVNTRWAEFGRARVIRMGQGMFVFQFATEAAKMGVLEKGPWTFSRHPLILRPWNVGMPMAKPAIASLPIWIQFPGLPLDLWTDEGLSLLASQIGAPMFADRATSEQSILSYARVCVDIDIHSVLHHEILINYGNGFVISQPVRYEWVPSRCTKCNMFGHIDVDCKADGNFLSESLREQTCELNGSAAESRPTSAVVVAIDKCGVDSNVEVGRVEEVGATFVGVASNGAASQQGIIGIGGEGENSQSPWSTVKGRNSALQPSNGDFDQQKKVDSKTNLAQQNSFEILGEKNTNEKLDDTDKELEYQATSEKVLEAVEKECEEEIKQIPTATRGRGRPKGATKEKDERLPVYSERSTRGRNKQANQNREIYDSQKENTMGEKSNSMNGNNETPEVVDKDDPDVVAVSDLTYEFVVAVCKRKKKSPWSRKGFENELARLKGEGADMVKIY